jgi:hypothetical protein
MQLKVDYLERVSGEVEDLVSRVALLKGRFAKQKVSVKLSTRNWHIGAASLPNSSGGSTASSTFGLLRAARNGSRIATRKCRPCFSPEDPTPR